MNNTVLIWQRSLLIPEEQLPQLRQLLSPDEIERADRFVYAKDRRKFTVARASLRQILADYLNADSSNLSFSYNEHGKPSLNNIDDPPFFNVSHSGEIAVYAICPSFPVGIDIENLKFDIEAADIAKRFFAESEGKVIATLRGTQRIDAFFRCWTRKEALLKALGQGLSFSLQNCEVSLMPGEPARIVSIHGDKQLAKEWSAHAFEPAPGYMGAIVVHGRVDDFKFINSQE